MSDLKREQIRQGANPMVGVPQHILDLLDRLHEESIKQESTMSYADYASRSEEEKSAAVRDKFIALDKDKAQLVYSLLRASDARTIVEAGTSFGVSTIYLALAAAANAKKGTGKKANVIATEHEPTKAAKAREYWQECGHEVSSVIDLREGDLRETLKDNLEDVDFLLLDIWTPMVMPTLKVVLPKLRHGAIILADNTLTSTGYDEYIDFIRNPDNGFVNVTLPYTNGFEMSVYTPQV